MFFSEKMFLLWRRVISASLGCFQLPGLSWTTEGIEICLTGVDLACATATAEEDMALYETTGIIRGLAGWKT